jgi:hypothetical protein
VITTRLIGDAELRRLEKLPGAAEQRSTGALAKPGLELQAVIRNKPGGNARSEAKSRTHCVRL